MSFIDGIKNKAKQNIKTIVLPESEDKRTIEAAYKITKDGFAKVALIKSLNQNLDTHGFDLSGVEIIDMASGDTLSKFAAQYYELRKSKGITEEQALKAVCEPITFATMMMKNDMADGMVAGACHSTGDTLRPALQIIKAKKGIKTVSSFFMMEVPNCTFGNNGLFLFSDCGLVEFPDANQLVDIAVSSAKTFETLTKEEPRVALLSYSTHGSAKNPGLQKVLDASAIIKDKYPNLRADGEIQADAAIVPFVGASKAPGSVVAGTANILIFPDLNAGNICYKLVQRLAKANAYGPITQGLNKPVNDLSRGCSADDIVGVAAITCVQASQN